MRWPWVSRTRLLDSKRVNSRLLESMGQWTTRAVNAEAKIAMAEAARDELRTQLEKSERERTDLQLKLLRVGFGLNPFHELLASENQTLAPSQPAAAAPPGEAFTPLIPEGADPDTVRTAYVQEALAKYGSNVRKIQRHVEQRLGEYYATRQRPPVVSHVEMAKANQIATDLQAAIEEGRAAQARGE